MTLLAVLAAALVFVSLVPAPLPRRQVRARIAGEPIEQREPLWLLKSLGRRVCGKFVDAGDEALAGAAVMVLPLVAVLLGGFWALVCLAGVVVAVQTRQKARIRQRRHDIERDLPEAIDLLGLVFGAGRPAAVALAEICERVNEPLRSELHEVVQRSAAGEPFVEALSRLHSSLGPPVADLVYAVSAAETDGVPLGPALIRAAEEAHRRRRVRAEEAARRIPVKMLFPLVLCVLLAFCLLTVVPLLVGSIADLQLPG